MAIERDIESNPQRYPERKRGIDNELGENIVSVPETGSQKVYQDQVEQAPAQSYEIPLKKEYHEQIPSHPLPKYIEDPKVRNAEVSKMISGDGTDPSDMMDLIAGETDPYRKAA